VIVMTLRFGEIEIEESRVIKMPDGMLGFPDRRFTILAPSNQDRFFWLQSLDNPELAFVVTEPAMFVQGYEFNMTSEEYGCLQLNPGSDAVILTVVTMARDVMEMTLNLQGPIVVNPEKMLAKQIVLEEGKYGTKHPLFSGSTISLTSPDKDKLPSSAPFLEKIITISCNR
jgi:flagellar assembly factor FliW